VEVLHAGRRLAVERVSRILALKLDHIGDFITAFPALRLLKERFPHASLTVLTPKASLAVAGLEPAIDASIEFSFFNPHSELGARVIEETELHALPDRLRALRFDLAIDLRMQADTRHMLRYTGAALLAGFDCGGRFPWLDVTVEWDGDPALVAKRAHAAERYMTPVSAVAVACEPARSAPCRPRRHSPG
jgi:ADP-heptose:LPS heptosyltransferase